MLGGAVLGLAMLCCAPTSGWDWVLRAKAKLGQRVLCCAVLWWADAVSCHAVLGLGHIPGWGGLCAGPRWEGTAGVLAPRDHVGAVAGDRVHGER